MKRITKGALNVHNMHKTSETLLELNENEKANVNYGSEIRMRVKYVKIKLVVNHFPFHRRITQV